MGEAAQEVIEKGDIITEINPSPEREGSRFDVVLAGEHYIYAYSLAVVLHHFRRDEVVLIQKANKSNP